LCCAAASASVGNDNISTAASDYQGVITANDPKLLRTSVVKIGKDHDVVSDKQARIDNLRGKVMHDIVPQDLMDQVTGNDEKDNQDALSGDLDGGDDGFGVRFLSSSQCHDSIERWMSTDHSLLLFKRNFTQIIMDESSEHVRRKFLEDVAVEVGGCQSSVGGGCSVFKKVSHVCFCMGSYYYSYPRIKLASGVQCCSGK
jgi:hypothetical protein